MVMYPLHIAFSNYAIIGLTLFILAASTAIYMLRLPSKSTATWSMIGFFIMIAISGGMSIFSNGFFYWDRLFIPWQDFWILAAGVALTKFAYSFPDQEDSFETRFAPVVVGGLAFIALVYCITFNFRFLFDWTPGLDVIDAYYLLLPLGTLLIVIIFLRRSVITSLQARSVTDPTKTGGIWHLLIHPQSEEAMTFRNLGLALALAFLPGLQTLLSLPNPIGLLLSNIGSLLAINTIALVYFSYSAAGKGIMAKVVGIALSTVLLIFSIIGTIDVNNSQNHMNSDRWLILASIHNSLIRSGDVFSDPSQVAYIVSWNAADPKDASAYREIYLSTTEAQFNLDTLIGENQKGYIETWSRPTTIPVAQLQNEDIRYIRRYWTYPLGSSNEDYQGFVFIEKGVAFEVGFPSLVASDFLSTIVLKWLILLLASSAFVLVAFPLFFRRVLVDPLQNLLDGISKVNQSDFDITIPIIFNDEIGFLTQSFNQMASTLKRAEITLQNRALVLKEEVNRRTFDLSQTNVRLEKENMERHMAEARLNQQLLYQKALADCSQSLLGVAGDQETQNEVLNQALEHLRSGVNASRAYVFSLFEDAQLGSCIGMLAEVCAPGIPPQIDNPTNQKFPLSRLPDEFSRMLKKRKAYGGPVRDVFTETPELKDALLSQKPPLLSIMLFPLYKSDLLWGFIGFDDCITEREWDAQEISILRTASEIISNTLQRWEIETQLNETLDQLEFRIDERTTELSQSNANLNEEIQQRQLIQKDLEDRLQIEEILATISTRLLEPMKNRDGIAASLEDLGRMMKAGRVFLVEFDLQFGNKVGDYIDWCMPEMPPVSEDVLYYFMNSLGGLADQMRTGETIYIEDTGQFQSRDGVNMQSLQARGIHSMVLSPIVIENRIHGVLGCSNLRTSPDIVYRNLRAVQVVAGMLQSLLEREHLIQTLEERIAERTHQLTTFLDMAMLSDQAQDLADILQPTLRSIIQIAACDAIGIFVTNEKESNLELIAQSGIPLKFHHQLSQIQNTPEYSSWIEDTHTYQGVGVQSSGPIFLKELFLLDYPILLMNRLHAGNKPLGLLICYRVGNKEFSPFQTTLLTALSEILGIIVENHRLRSEAQQLAVLEERQRLAREIHDAISQSVYSLSLFARSAKDALSDGNEAKSVSILQDIEVIALQSMREMRLLLFQLHEETQDQDLATALDERFKQVENRLNIHASHEIDRDITWPSVIKHEVWRIIVEALNNSIKHANASHVWVKIVCLDEHLFISIKDDGIGFIVKESYSGMGLKNIRERALAIAGKLDIISESGQGTEIRLQIPMTCGDEKGAEQ